MKKLYSLFIFILFFSMYQYTKAQTIGDTKEQVINKKGEPTERYDNKFEYLDDKILTIFKFKLGEVSSITLTSIMNKNQFKKLYDITVNGYGKEDVSGETDNKLYAAWDIGNKYLIIIYDIKTQIVSSMIISADDIINDVQSETLIL